MFFSMLLTALIPLLMLSIYVSARYYHKTAATVLRQNQLVEESLGGQVEDYLGKMEQVSNICFNQEIQDQLEKEQDLAGRFALQQLVERNIRVEMDFLQLADRVEGIGICKSGAEAYYVNDFPDFITRNVDFERLDEELDRRYKYYQIQTVGSLPGIEAPDGMEEWENRYVYVRKIRSTSLKKTTVAWFFLLFDRSQLDEIMKDLWELQKVRTAVTDRDGNDLYIYPEMGNEEWRELSVSFAAGKAAEENNCFIRDYEMENSGLTVRFYNDKTEILKELDILQEVLIRVILLSITLIIAGSLLLTRVLLEPIKKLHRNIEKMEKGDFHIRTEVKGNDETADMCRAFNQMAERIDVLINQVYTTQLKEKEAIIASLQSQINPHFLYNTLDMIKCMVEMKGVYEAGEMITALSDLFRYAVQNKEPMAELKEELHNLEQYMLIIRARFGEKIDYIIDVPEELYSYHILKICLQPIVENAINHGLARQSEAGKILVFIRKSEDMLRIVVKDTGIGMSADKLFLLRKELDSKAGEFSKEVSGTGLKNINDRIRLYYGERYGMVIDSKEGKGTTVALLLPADG